VNLGVINRERDEIRTDNSELMLFDDVGNVVWNVSDNRLIALPQISDDGKSITYLINPTISSLTHPIDVRLVTCNERGEVRWVYGTNARIFINYYKLSRDGRLVTLIQRNPETGIDELVVLADGVMKWRRRADFGRYYRMALSPGGRYIAVARGFLVGSLKKKEYSVIELYSIDGNRLWSVEVDGSADHLNVTDRGEVFLAQCFNSKCLSVFKASSIIGVPTLIKVFKRSVSGIRLSRNGDRVVVSDNVGLHAFDTDGNHLWSLRGTVASFDVSDDYIALTDGQRLLIASSRGEILQRIEVGDNIREVRISPDGRYVVAASESHVYFFENRDAALRERVRRVVAKLEELASI